MRLVAKGNNAMKLRLAPILREALDQDPLAADAARAEVELNELAKARRVLGTLAKPQNPSYRNDTDEFWERAADSDCMVCGNPITTYHRRDICDECQEEVEATGRAPKSFPGRDIFGFPF